jgi:hypothetical protein
MESSSTISVIGPSLQPSAIPRREEKGSVAEKSVADKSAAPQEAQRPAQVTQTEIKEIEQLKNRDREVRAHELAHLATAGAYARGGASFDYKIGPDGKRYAVGGEVNIDISKDSDPQKTLEKAQVIRRAALAPAEPSGQDRRIAMQAAVMAAEARQELLAQSRESAEASSEEQPAEDSKQLSPSPTGRRALNLFKAVETASLAAREDPFDHFI